MTPEDRASFIMRDVLPNLDPATRTVLASYVPAAIAGQIREAVLEEREACAKVCREAGAKDFGWPHDTDCDSAVAEGTLEYACLACRCEHSIRARGKP